MDLTPTSCAADGVAGFYGKITSHGDFVMRRLPAPFVTAWDTWLQEGFRDSRERLGPQWLNAYLVSPIWRFLLMPGVCGSMSWAGVLMPSVDRVGRHFPLTIAAGFAKRPSLADWLRDTSNWYAELERVALSTLHEDLVFETFDESVQTITPLSQGGAQPECAEKPASVCIGLASVDSIASVMPHIGMTLADTMSAGCSLWWTDGSAAILPCLVACQGLPTPEQFTALLDGKWPTHGWQQPL